MSQIKRLSSDSYYLRHLIICSLFICGDLLLKRLEDQLRTETRYTISQYPGIRKYAYLFEDNSPHLSSFLHGSLFVSCGEDRHLLHSSEHPGSYHAGNCKTLHNRSKMSI